MSSDLRIFSSPVKPRWIKELPDVVSVKLNGELNVDCQAAGYPQPKIKLERILNGNILESFENGQLRTRYTKLLAGQYRCTAENSVSRIEKEFQVKHYGKASNSNRGTLLVFNFPVAVWS